MRGEKLARMRLEGHHARLQPGGRTPAQGLKDGAVAAMHAVEIADGQRRRRRGELGNVP